ncbi:MAG: hypothetical protein M1834_008482 [Cirrosporium novae-zelandiae]|nr:MAG: hypothetical protein M1834_008482 [Cirrosporium novae-zelandiae]
MSERKVLSKYYPPDFDPSKLTRHRGPKTPGPKVQTVRLMAPFSMKCTSCGEFVYKGRKFNARKETTDEKYYSIAIYRFYIRCTRCSGEITFKTDPKNMDYTCEKGAKRNFEPWRNQDAKEETEEERLDRIEREEEEKNAMVELEAKTLDAKREMQIADALDSIRTRNAMNERVDRAGEGMAVVRSKQEDEIERQDQEDEELAKRAFMAESGERVRRLGDDQPESTSNESTMDTTDVAVDAPTNMPLPTFKRVVKKKKNFSSALGIKKKPTLV